MRDEFMDLRVRRATYLFYLSACAILGFVVIGYLAEVPAVASRLDSIEATVVGRAAGGAVLAAMFLSAVVVTCSAIWYARVSPDVLFPRTVVIGLLVLTNFVGSFFYYWCAVHWRAGTRRIRSLRHPFSREPAS